MKKFTFLAVIFVVLGVLGVMGCKSKPPAYKDDPRSKIVGKEGVLRPEWMNGTKKSEDLYYVIGDGFDGMKSKTAQQGTARTDGLAKVSQWKSAVVADTMKNYIEEGGTTGNTQVLMRFEQATITRANSNVSGFDMVEYWIDADGVYHGLFSYPKSDLRKDFQTTVSEFQRNEAAAFADFKAQEAFKQLEAQLNKK